MEQWESGGPAGKAAAGLKKLYGLLKGEKRLRLLLALGLAGILLIALSGLLPEKDAPEPVSEADTQAYERRHQEQVTELVGQYWSSPWKAAWNMFTPGRRAGARIEARALPNPPGTPWIKRPSW